MNADAILSYASKSRESANSLSLFANTTQDDVSDDRLLKDLPKTTPWTFGQKLENELSALGFYISAHPLDQYKHLLEKYKLATSVSLAQLGDRKQVQIAANINSWSRRKTKTGKDMLTINASDSYGNIDCVAFGESAIELSQVLSSETEVIISGKTSVRDERVSVFVDSIMPLNKWIAKIARKITIDIRDQNVLTDVKKALSALPGGNTQVVLNLHSGDKTASLALKQGLELGPTTAKDLIALGTKVAIE
jgi:DNA polymerase-3 subunit alpha